MINHHAKARDITKIDPEELIEDFGLGSLERAVDVIVGGPPCQAYARVGRAKLREIAEHPQAFKVDPRANLYLRYLHYIERLKPLALLIDDGRRHFLKTRALSFALYLVMLAVTLIHIAILFVYGRPEWKEIASAYLGLLLMGPAPFEHARSIEAAGRLTIAPLRMIAREKALHDARAHFGAMFRPEVRRCGRNGSATRSRPFAFSTPAISAP